MDPKNKKTESLSALSVTPELYQKLVDDAAANFEKLTDCVRRRLEASFAGQTEAPVVFKTAAAELRERKEILAVEKMERDAARERKEMISTDAAYAVVVKDYAQIRQFLLSFAQTLALDLGLDDKGRDLVATRMQDAMTDLSGEKRETFDDLAKQS